MALKVKNILSEQRNLFLNRSLMNPTPRQIRGAVTYYLSARYRVADMTDNRPGTGLINCEAPFKLGGRR